jgi:hypothetical protein
MDGINRAVFVGLSVANIPPASWDCQVFVNHVSHAGTVTGHEPTVPTVTGVATMSFDISDGGTSHTITGTCNIANGKTTFTIDGGDNLPAPTNGKPQLDAGGELTGSQVWFRYDDSGTLREYRLHTGTNLQFLADALHDNNLTDLENLIRNLIP